MKKSLFPAVSLCLMLTAACQPSGFISNLKDGVKEQADPVTNVSADTKFSQGASPKFAGTVSLGGILVSESNGQLTLNPQIQVNRSFQTPANPKMSLLEGVDNENSYIQSGCDNDSLSIKRFTGNLPAANPQTEIEDTLSLKAKVVVLCGKLKWTQSFITILTDHLILLDSQYESAPESGIGFVAIYANKLTLLGTSQITSKGADSKALLKDGPSITLFVREALEGKGILNIKATGGSLLAGKKK